MNTKTFTISELTASNFSESSTITDELVDKIESELNDNIKITTLQEYEYLQDKVDNLVLEITKKDGWNCEPQGWVEIHLVDSDGNSPDWSEDLQA